MIHIQSQINLKEHNTFGISAFAKAYTNITTVTQLTDALSYYHDQEVFLLGGGSNMLILKDIEKPVLHLNIKGIEILEENKDHILVTSMAGENWHEFVMHCIENNWAGIENLALIPGNVGTSPIQNIGAYGIELKDVFHSCDVIDIKTGEHKQLSLADCQFGYRDSIFKNEARGQYVITAVTFKLTNLNKTDNYDFKTSYGAIQNELEQLDGSLSIEKVARAVVNIRSSKLPDSKILGNSGSFFKNPIIKKEIYDDLLRMHPELPHYPVNDSLVKVPAGWLIDRCGFKGKRYGDAGIHDKQALVLVNHGEATGSEVLQVARTIQQAVKDRYGIEIDTEVNLINE